MYGKSALVNAI